MPPDLHSRNAEARPCAFACQKGLNKPVNGASSFPHAALPGFCSGNGIIRRKNRPARIVHAVAFENSKGFIRALRRVFDSPARSARFPARNKAEERRAFRAENFRNGRFEPSSKAALSLSKNFDKLVDGRASLLATATRPVLLKIFQISGRKNCKETIFLWEMRFSAAFNRPAPAIHAAEHD